MVCRPSTNVGSAFPFLGWEGSWGGTSIPVAVTRGLCNGRLKEPGRLRGPSADSSEKALPSLPASSPSEQKPSETSDGPRHLPELADKCATAGRAAGTSAPYRPEFIPRVVILRDFDFHEFRSRNGVRLVGRKCHGLATDASAHGSFHRLLLIYF